MLFASARLPNFLGSGKHFGHERLSGVIRLHVVQRLCDWLVIRVFLFSFVRGMLSAIMPKCLFRI